MATAQALVLLCVVCAAVAAPQGGLSRSAAGGESEEQVVSSVISALGPSIAQAVEEALRNLNAAAAAEEEALAAAAAEAAAAEAAAAEQWRLQQQEAARQEAARQEQFRQQQIAQANAARAAAAAEAAEQAAFEAELSASLGPQARAVYNFQYKVADEEAQTYISHNEERDGDAVTGSYSYVDATGSLVKVDYTAGLEGYAETRTKEAGFVTMRAVPAWTGPLAGIDDVATGAVAIPARASSFGASSGSVSGAVRSRTSSSGTSESDLIARILAALAPQINQAVASAIGA